MEGSAYVIHVHVMYCTCDVHVPQNVTVSIYCRYLVLGMVDSRGLGVVLHVYVTVASYLTLSVCRTSLK